MSRFFYQFSDIAHGFNHGNTIKKQSVSNPMFSWLKPKAMLFEISRFSTKSQRDEIFIDIILSYATEPCRGEIYVTPLELRF